MRDKLIFIGVAVVAVVIGVLVFLSGDTVAPDSIFSRPEYQSSATVAPDTSVQEEAQPSAVVVPFTKLIQGTQSKIAERVNYNIVSSSELKELWKMIGATDTPPAVDFTKQTVLAVFAGTESTSSIAIAKIEDTNARMVSIVITKPDSTCTQKGVTASPYEIVTVPTTSLSLAHEDVLMTSSCKN